MSSSWSAIDEMYEQALQPDAQIVYLADEIIKSLLLLQAAYVQTIHPKNVGIHTANRDGMGVVEESVHGILVDIHEDGFVWSAVEAACCFEDQPDGRHAKFTKDMCNEEPALANFDNVKFASVACTHTNQALAAANDGCLTEHEAIAFGGRISKAKLSEKNANMRTALDTGLRWTVIKSNVDTKYPRLAEIIQRAKNKVGQTQRRPDMWQTLMHIQRDACRLAKASITSHVDWAVVQRHAEKTKAECAPDVGAYISFLKLYGGEKLVERLARFAKKRIRRGNVVPGSLFKAIADMKLQPKELCPLLAHELIKTCGAADTKVVNGVCTFITGVQISAMAKKPKIMMEAEDFLRVVRDVNAKIGIDADMAADTAGNVLVRFALGLPHGANKVESIVDIGKMFYSKVVKAAQDGMTIDVPAAWTTAQPASAPASKQSSLQNIILVDEKGGTSGVESMVLAQHGFVVNAMVIDEAEVISRIVEVSEADGVTLVDINTTAPGENTSTKRTVAYQSFVESYKLTKLEMKWSEYPRMHYEQSSEHEVLLVKCAIHLAMSNFSEQGCINVREKPRSVFSASNIAANKLVLVPLTQGIKAISADQPPPKMPQVNVKDFEGFDFYATPSFLKDLPVPFWFVKSTFENDEANVIMKHRDVKVSIGSRSFVIGVPFISNLRVTM